MESNKEVTFGFGKALVLLKDHRRVCRAGWNGKGMFLLLISPYANDQYSLVEKDTMVGTLAPYIALKAADNSLVPWQPSQTDMLAMDWISLDKDMLESEWDKIFPSEAAETHVSPEIANAPLTVTPVIGSMVMVVHVGFAAGATESTTSFLPALVLAVGESQRVSAFVFDMVGRDTGWVKNVPFNPGKEPHTWHWPSRT